MTTKPAALTLPGLFCLCFLSSCHLPAKDAAVKLNTDNRRSLFDVNSSHANHPASLTEWWYFNGHLQTNSKHNYAYGLCFFRASALLYFAHISLTDESGNEFFFDRIFYPSKKVSFQKQKQLVSFDNDQLFEQVNDQEFHIRGKLKDIDFDLRLALQKQPMLVNGNGRIDMPEGGNSFYYSLTRLRTSGSISMNNKTEQVNGLSWMDHQWGNFIVKNRGWDWFSLQFDDSTDYNIYSFRNEGGKTKKQFINILDGNDVLSSTREALLDKLRWWTNPATGRNYVTAWQIYIPSTGDTLAVVAKNEEGEVYQKKSSDFFPSYWEGPCIVLKKTREGRIVEGKGFAEHFPYPLRK